MANRHPLHLTRCAIAAASLLWALEPVSYGACPAFVKKTAIVGEQTSLPDGIVVYALRSGAGVYRSSVRQFSPTLIPNTNSDNARDVSISSDGKWIVYGVQTSVYVVGIDGQHRTKVPTAPISVQNAVLNGIYRQSPKGTEIYYKDTDTRLRAISIAWDTNGPVFRADRIIGEFGNTLYYSVAVARNHIFGRQGIRSQFATIPDNGNGKATDATLWQFSGAVDQGCSEAISYDGTLCCHNPGFITETECIPAELGGMRHRGFVLMPFMESTAPLQDWTTFVMTNAVSINWCPDQYRIGGTNDINFDEWEYTNDNAYVCGSLRGNLATTKGAWLVHWPSNTWTQITGQGANVANPAVHFSDPVSIAPTTHCGRIGAVSAPRSSQVTVDIRGRAVPVGIIVKLPPTSNAWLLTLEGTTARVVIGGGHEYAR